MRCNIRTLLLAACLLGAAWGQAPAAGPATGPRQTPNTAFSANGAPVVAPGGWREGRATFYGAPDYFAEAFASRGEGAFGDVNYGSCQYYSRGLGEQTVTEANQAVPKDMIAALASADPDYPGSCGRCYEVQCRNGLVIQEGTTPVRSADGYDLQAIGPDVLDTQGRAFPGQESDTGNFVRCWNDTGSTGSIFVQVTDTCPCESATANNTQWCCGPVWHLDLSFWAFERLAHPLHGTMMLNFRPVDCYTKQPFLQFLPGFINETIYGDRVETGWSFNVYGSDAQEFALAGAGVGGSAAACLAPRPQGGVTFTARNASQPGYQPFSAAGTLTLAIRNNGTAGASGVPAGLKATLQNSDEELYCSGDVFLGQNVQPVRTAGDFSVFSIPISQFGCESVGLDRVTGLGLQNVGGQSLSFCLDDIALLGGSGASTAATAGRKLK